MLALAKVYQDTDPSLYDSHYITVESVDGALLGQADAKDLAARDASPAHPALFHSSS